MEPSIIISVISLIIALFVAIYSVYNIERDNAKIMAWAEVVRDSGFHEKNKGINVLTVSVVNIGRRPIIIKGFKVEAKGLSFDIPAKDPDFDVKHNLNSGTNFEIVRDEVRKQFSTQNTCVVLKEGEFFESELIVGNLSNDLVTYIDGKFYEGENVLVQNIQGGLYPISNFKNKIELFNRQT